MKPEAFFAAYRSDGGQRIECVGGSSANRGRDEEWNQAGLAVVLNLACQRVAAHGKALVDFDQPQVVHADSGNHRRFLERGMRLVRSVGHQMSIAASPVADIVGSALACC